MKYKYSKPIAEIVIFNEDVITTSGETSGGKPGWGHGDNNHDHWGLQDIIKEINKLDYLK